ncbi:phosphoribosylanthranilate isomerase [Peribacillus saganii]|uniref:N-(5'-phosphoribosyl)anthranilate isomerase n=1 Tax=Peribacillus saganii TaxID=2303992 RepID=A0A372LTJ4_9BACI|nr:phosphoribosylanthranilate isomerase [Peribacillus saganii]RFU71120.1 phosphoribosylanthranilate isomerase [Peribacillus saganii]
MYVKICGITTHEAAQAACAAGADILGFVFAPSKRKITPEQAQTIIEKLPGHVITVGVFVNEELETIEEIVQTAGLDYVQLHGDESPDFATKLSVPVIKAFGIESSKDIKKASMFETAYYLFDSPKGKFRGGNGTSFDWVVLEENDFPNSDTFLAGGLTPENVKEAIWKVRPIAVDVSSGVETNGVKDHDKIKRFVNEAKLAFKQLEESDINGSICTAR